MSTLDIPDESPANVDTPTRSSTLDYTPQLVALIGIAAFITTFGQPGQIGAIPLQFLIVKKMHYDATKLASFMFLSALAWYFKPLAGLILDSFPLMGTRRRSYMIGASAVSVIWWIVLGFSSSSFEHLLYAAIGLNIFMMIASTAMGALLVEYGQMKAATGGVSSIREGVQNVGLLLVGVTGGFLAKQSFTIVGFCGAALMAVLALCAFTMLREHRSTVDTGVWRQAGRQIRTLASSKPLLSAALMMLLIFLAPGYGAMLSVMQIKVLHFTPENVGLLTTISAALAIAGAATYAAACRKVNLRLMLAIGIVLNIASTLSLFYYKSFHAALIIVPIDAFIGTLAVLPVYDLAARATPPGCEGLGFSLMMSVRNLALFGSNFAGAAAAQKYNISFHTMLIINASFTACVLLLIPFIPKFLVARRDGGSS